MRRINRHSKDSGAGAAHVESRAEKKRAGLQRGEIDHPSKKRERTQGWSDRIAADVEASRSKTKELHPQTKPYPPVVPVQPGDTLEEVRRKMGVPQFFRNAAISPAAPETLTIEEICLLTDLMGSVEVALNLLTGKTRDDLPVPDWWMSLYLKLCRMRSALRQSASPASNR